ncbi:uncharacterized protein BDW70DRAFT_137144 [Aspergillus foveolatus]|uniref:uncharacterized protein n=1 Tax=Aspergillus foveolatus TaxID=210207 RepID=UPI003CCDE131
MDTALSFSMTWFWLDRQIVAGRQKKTNRMVTGALLLLLLGGRLARQHTTHTYCTTWILTDCSVSTMLHCQTQYAEPVQSEH